MATPNERSEPAGAGMTVPADVIRPGTLPPLRYRDLPDPPRLRRLIGPGIILAGLSLGSGEFILWPYITYKSQFVFFWACLLGVTTQYFLNTEIGRWTLATGETAVTGFVRMNRHWAWVFLAATLIPHMIPAWSKGAAKLVTWLAWPPAIQAADGGEKLASAGDGYVSGLAIAGMFLCGIILTAGPIVYKTVERLQALLVALILLLVLVIAFLVVRPDAIEAQAKSAATFGAPQFVPDRSDEMTTALLLGALAFAGAGGTLNLGQSNYIKDKGFAMGCHIGRITSPITGRDEAISEVGYHFHHTPENLARWRRWWILACREHFLTFFLTCVFCLVVLTLISYSLFYTPEGVLREGVAKYGKDMNFIYGESVQLVEHTGTYARMLFLVMGVAILLTTELGVLDCISRVAADVVKVAWLRENDHWSESRLYYAFLWGEIAFGTIVLLIGEQRVKDATLGLFTLVAAINGAIMCIYSATLLWLNCRRLPGPLRTGRLRTGMLVWAFLFFGFFAVWAAWDSAQKLLNPAG